jgi:hypothetical protein
MAFDFSDHSRMFGRLDYSSHTIHGVSAVWSVLVTYTYKINVYLCINQEMSVIIINIGLINYNI